MTEQPESPGDTANVTRRKPASPRKVLLWVVVVIAVGYASYAVAPWILPARIYEGPLVQMATEDGVTLVWYTTRPVECTVAITVDGTERVERALADGSRNSVRVDGLAPGTAYDYEVRVDKRPISEGLKFVTNRADERRYSFIVFGDSGRGTPAQYELATEMTRAQPDPELLLHTGDLIYSGGGRHRYNERFFTPYRDLISRVNFWPCLGNHEIDDDGQAAPYQEVFEVPANGPAGLPEDFNYWFDYAGSRFAVIDTNADEAILREQVAPWLIEVMSDPAPRWKFVAFHHPPYSGGKYKPDERVQRALVPALEQAGVDIVFCGHDHGYERTHPLRGGEIVEAGQGVTYIITAAAGAHLYEPKSPRPEYVALLNHEVYSYTQITILDNQLTLRQIALGGSAIDELILNKPATARRDEPAGPG